MEVVGRAGVKPRGPAHMLRRKEWRELMEKRWKWVVEDGRVVVFR